MSRQFRGGAVALALVSVIGTALVLAPPAVAAASAQHHAAQTHAPMQPTPPDVTPPDVTPPELTPGLAPAGTVTATNWSGFAATGTTFSSVSASWVVPTATCPSPTGNQFSSSWVGLDGFNSGTVEQIGTDSDCATGTPTYFAWYEMFPAAPFNLAKPVVPGDQMSASIAASTATTFVLTISDATRGWSRTFNQTLTAGAQRSSAEVIEEAPGSATGGILPLANFGVINFSNADANGQRIGTFPHQRINMVSATGITKATTSALAQGAFSVTWNHR